MQQEDENEQNIPGVSLDFDAPTSPAGFAKDEEQQSLTAFGELLRYDNNRKKVLDAGKAVGETIDLTFKNATQVLPIESESSDDVSIADYRRRFAPTEAEKQSLPIEIGHSSAGIGTALSAIAQGFKNAGITAPADFLDEKAKEITANAPKKTFTDVRQVKGITDALKYVWEYGTEAAGSSAPFLVAGALGGVPGAAVVGNVMGQGQVRQSLLEEFNSFYDLADQLDNKGETQKARVLRGYADQLHPDKHREVVARIGTVIGALDAGSAYISIFRGAPEGIVRDVKKRLYKRVAQKILMRVIEGSSAEAVTEASQDFMADLAVIEAKGLTSWAATVDQAESEKWKYINSAAAGAAGGGLMAAASSSLETAKGVLDRDKDGLRGTEGPALGKGIPQTIEEPAAPEAATQPDPLPKEEAPEPVAMDESTRNKFRSYLANPQNMVGKKSHEAIAEALGVSPEKVPGILEAATQEGLIRKDQRGIYRRNPPQETIIPETGEAAGDEFIAPEPEPVVPESTDDAPTQPASSIEDTVGVPEVGQEAAGVPEAEATVVAGDATETTEATVEATPEKQIPGLEAAIEADTQRIAEIREEIRSAPAQDKQALRQESADLQKRIKASQRRLAELENAPPATPVAAPVESQPVSSPVAPAQPTSKPSRGPLKGTPEGGLSFIRYLTKTGGVTVPRSQQDGDAPRKSRTRFREYFYGRGRGSKDLAKFPALVAADGKGRSVDDPALWDDLVSEGYIPNYMNPETGELLYDPKELILEKIGDGLGGKDHYSDKYDRAQDVDRDAEEQAIRNAALDLVETLTEGQLSEVVELVQSGNYSLDNAIELATGKERQNVYDEITEETEQSSVFPGDEREAGTEGGTAEALRGSDADLGEAGYERRGDWLFGPDGSAIYRPREDVIPFAIYTQERGNAARTIGQRIENALRKAFGLTEEQKTQRLISKIKPVTLGGRTIKFKWFDETLENLSATERKSALGVEAVSGRLPAALYTPGTDTIALATYGASTGDKSRAILTHELIHALANLGQLTTDEINTLAQLSVELGYWDKNRERLYRQYYSGWGKAERERVIQEEKAAILVQRYMENVVKLEEDKGLIKEILDRIVEILTNLRNAFKEEKIEARDIFNSLLDAHIANGKAGRYVTNNKARFAISKVMETMEDKANAILERRKLDELGYYSALLEKAESLPQNKGSGQQFAKMLEKGTKAAERQATGLDGFLQSKPNFTKQEIIDFLTNNRVKLVEAQNRADPEYDKKQNELAVARGKARSAVEAAKRELKEAMASNIVVRSSRVKKAQAKYDDAEFEFERLNREIQDLYWKNNGGGEGRPKFRQYSLDGSNPTYGETILHLPGGEKPYMADVIKMEEIEERAAKGEQISDDDRQFWNRVRTQYDAFQSAYRTGHFPQSNIIGHLMHSLVRYAGKQVFLVDQIQSDWGQLIRDSGGEFNEQKLAQMQTDLSILKDKVSESGQTVRSILQSLDNLNEGSTVLAMRALLNQWREIGEKSLDYLDIPQEHHIAITGHMSNMERYSLLQREVNTYEGSRGMPRNPLVNSTDQWTTTTLRRALRMAVESGSEYIAIPSGQTVLSYNPGKESGMEEFYDNIVPKNLRNIFSKMGAETVPFRVETLDSPSGYKGLGKGFTLFEIPAVVRRKVMEEGQPLFAISKASDEMAAQPAPRVGEKRSTLSIKGLKKPMSPAEAAEALRAEREKRDKLLGPFAPRPELSDWTGLPQAYFQADIQHILNKRQAKDDERFMRPLKTLEEVRSVIEDTLDNAQFAYVHHTGNLNLIYVKDDEEYVVAIKLKASGHPLDTRRQIEIPTAFVTKRGQNDKKLLASLEEGGIENVSWRKGVTEIDRLLYIVRQARGPGKHPSIAQLTKKLQEEQLALKGVKPDILFAIARSASGQEIQGVNTITRRLADGLGVTLRQGYGPQWGYKSRAGTIRQKAYYDFSQFAQNLAPLLEDRHNWVSPLVAQHAAEIGTLAQTMDPQDGYVQFMELYLTDPAMALRRAPGFYNDFEDAMEIANPAHLAVMQSTQLALQEYFAANPIESVESMVTPAERTTRMAKVAKEIDRDGTFATLKHGFLYVYSQTIAADAPLKTAVRTLLEMDLAKRGQKRWLKAIDNPAKLFRLIPNAQSVATMDIKEGIQMRDGTIRGPGLPEVLRTALGSDKTTAMDLRDGSTYSHFLSYLVALRAKQLWERRFAGDLEHNPTIVPYQTVVQAITDLETKYPDFVEAQRKLNQFTRALLRLKLDAGLIDQKTFAELDKDQFYVPFQRSFDEEVSVAFQKSGKVSVENIMKSLKGSNRDIIDPIAMLSKDVYTTRQLIAVNDTIAALLRLAESIGPEGGKIAERINAKQAEGTNILIEDAVRQASKAAGLSKSDTQNLLSQVAAEVGSDALATAFKQVTIKPGGQPIALFMEGGKLQAVSLNDPVLGKMIFDSLQLFNEQSSFLIDAASMPAQAERFTITTNPAFILANLVRDALHAPGYERKMIPFVSQISGAIRIFKGDPLLNEYIRAGGIMGGVGAHGIDQRRFDDGVKKLVGLGYEVNAYTGIGDFVREWQTRIEVTETMTRLELYRIAKDRALKQGLSEIEAQREAAFYANDYCDYSRNGIRSYAVRKMIAFWNASIQGVDRFRQTVAGQSDYGSVFKPYLNYMMGKGPDLTPGEWNALYQSGSAFFYWFFVVGSISALVWVYNNDDERIRDVPDWMKATHWVIPIGGVINLIGKDTWLGKALDAAGGDDDLARIPKPFESAWLANLVERFLWEQQKDDPNWAVKWGRDVYDTVLPPLEPAWMKLYGIARYGKDPLTGRDIENPYMKKLDPKDRYTPFTSEMAKWLGEQTNSSPVHIDAAMKALGTSWARDLLSLNIPGSPWYNPSKPTLGMDEYVIARRFLWQTGKQSEAGRIVREMMGEEEILRGVFQRLSVPYSQLASSAESYSRRLKQLSPDAANRFLAELTPRERGFSILVAGLSGKDSKYEKLDPVMRASEIGKATFQIQQELTNGVLVLDKGTKKEKREGTNAITQRRARDILIQIQAQEHHNALVLTKEPGYGERVMFDTSGLYEELKQADPAVHKELKRRLDKAHVMPWNGIQAVWPELKKRLESDDLYKEAQRGKPEAVERRIRDLWFKAKYPAGMMRLGGPVETNPTMEVSDDLAADLEYSAAGKPYIPPPDEDDDGGWQVGVGQERENFGEVKK